MQSGLREKFHNLWLHKMYGEIVDMDILYYLSWLYQLPWNVFGIVFNAGFWFMIGYLAYRGFRDIWDNR